MKDSLPPAGVWEAWLTWRRWLVASTLRPYWADPLQRTLHKPQAQWEAAQGEQLSARDVHAADAARNLFFQQMPPLFAHHDDIALPAAQVWPFNAAQHWRQAIGDRQMDTHHRWMEVVIYATLAGLPAISVPVGFRPEGLPMGMQLIGRPLGEHAVVQLAHAHEIGWPDMLARRPAALA